MVLVSPRFVRWATLNFARAITLFPFIFLRCPEDRRDWRLMNHEQIHLRQQLELLILPFYVLYLMEYLIGRIGGKGHYAAYRAISFEREAFQKEQQRDYLNFRPLFAFTRYWRAG